MTNAMSLLVVLCMPGRAFLTQHVNGLQLTVDAWKTEIITADITKLVTSLELYTKKL